MRVIIIIIVFQVLLVVISACLGIFHETRLISIYIINWVLGIGAYEVLVAKPPEGI